MKYLLMLALPLSLMSAPFEDSDHKKGFFYANLGGYYSSSTTIGTDLGFGYRHIFGLSAFDVNLGVTFLDPAVPFAQGSYLIYPHKWNGPYLGVGVSVVPLFYDSMVLVNFPLIAGYQMPWKAHPTFIQFQYSAFMAPGGTLSLGVGF